MPIQTEVPANLYFSDDEHFNKKLQTGASATTLFKDAMSQHRRQQYEYLYQQKQQKTEREKSTLSGGGGGDRNSPTLSDIHTQQQQPYRRESIGSPLLQTAASGRGAASFLANNN